MTIYETIKDLIENDKKQDLGYLLCYIQDRYANIENIEDEYNTDGNYPLACEICPASNLCRTGHNGWVHFLDNDAPIRWGKDNK